MRLGDLSKVIGEIVFIDDETRFLIRLNQAEVMESLHRQADPKNDLVGRRFVQAGWGPMLELFSAVARVRPVALTYVEFQ